MDILTVIANLAIGGVALAPVIIGLVALAKRLGLPDRLAPFANGGLSVLAYLAVRLLEKYPAYMEFATMVVVAIAIFLVSSGVYQLAKTDESAA